MGMFYSGVIRSPRLALLRFRVEGFVSIWIWLWLTKTVWWVSRVEGSGSENPNPDPKTQPLNPAKGLG